MWGKRGRRVPPRGGAAYGTQWWPSGRPTAAMKQQQTSGNISTRALLNAAPWW